MSAPLTAVCKSLVRVCASHVLEVLELHQDVGPAAGDRVHELVDQLKVRTAVFPAESSALPRAVLHSHACGASEQRTQ